MAGLWQLSRTLEIGTNGRPAVGRRAYFYQPGTLIPLQTYTDYSLAVPNPSFIETDGFGRWPSAYLDDSEDVFFRIRMTESSGTVIYDDDAVPIIGPGDGGGGDPPAPVDPNALFETGDIKIRYETGTIQGWVRGNGRQIGSAVSGATERANADTQPLFEHLWETDSTLAVSGGRGLSATADFEANKTITLPDFRGRALAGLDTMGNSAAGRLSGIDAIGEATGGASTTLTAGQIPELSGTTNTTGAHTHNLPENLRIAPYDGGTQGDAWRVDGGSVRAVASAGNHSHTITLGSSSPTSVSLVQPTIGVTVYIKL